MESLHLDFQGVIDANLFFFISIGNVDPIVLSHLFYVDDIIFMGE